MSRRFVLVTASYVENGKIFAASGIRKLKRGVGMAQFIREHLESVGVHHDDTDILSRGDTWMVKHVAHPDGSFVTNSLAWNYTEYAEDDLLHAVSHLTKEELLRDLKDLLPLKAK